LNHKYKNNYDYNKSIYLINGVKHFDNGFLVATPSENLVSPISVIFYEEYENEQDLTEKLAVHEEKFNVSLPKIAGSQIQFHSEMHNVLNWMTMPMV
jgi:hypothetical protein